MSLPGFTADVVASRSVIVPARSIPITRHGKALAYCNRIGGTYWSEGPTTATYGCVTDEGDHGIVCSGVTAHDQATCDIW